MRRILLSVAELAAFALIAYGAWTLSPGWGYIVGGLLFAAWVAVEEKRRAVEEKRR